MNGATELYSVQGELWVNSHRRHSVIKCTYDCFKLIKLNVDSDQRGEPEVKLKRKRGPGDEEQNISGYRYCWERKGRKQLDQNELELYPNDSYGFTLCLIFT